MKLLQSKDNIDLLIFEKEDRERNKNMFFKESLNKISYISYHNYAHKFIFEDKLSYSDINKEPKDVFKNILNNEIKHYQQMKESLYLNI